MKRTISVWFPRLSTDRLSRPTPASTTRDWPSRAAVTIAFPQGGARIAAANGLAEAAGVRAGMKLADARALIPDLASAHADPEADRITLRRLARWCERYTPWTALDPIGGAVSEDGLSTPGFGGDAGLLLDVTGCTHLFGKGEAGERAMLTDVVSRLTRLGFHCRAAMADTTGAAWALARYAERTQDRLCPAGEQRDRLAALPVEGLRLDAATLDTLNRLGLRRIGDLYPLPRAPLARRFGEALNRRLDEALGRAPETVEPLQPAPAFRTRLNFAEPIGRAEDVNAAAGRLVAALCRQLEAAGLGARRLELTLYRVDGSVERTEIGVSRPSRDNPHLMRLFSERLAELDPGYGVELMMLAAHVVEPTAPAQGELAPETLAAPLQTRPLAPALSAPALHAAAASDHRTVDLVDRLTQRLGRAAAVRLLPRPSHAPERAVVPVAAGGARPAQAGLWRRLASFKGPRPTRLLSRPEPIEVVAPAPDDPPRLFSWRNASRRVARAEGPERLAEEWWRAEGDPAEIAQRTPEVRDYYRIEDTDGHRFWVYRDGPMRMPSAANDHAAARWYLHGFCA